MKVHLIRPSTPWPCKTLLTLAGGLSTSIRSLKANILLSSGVAITGIGFPIELSFILRRLINASPIQCFAAGAALCSTSLGTTFTVLSTSGLTQSRLGVVLTSAAMMDDVVGLVMVQVISNLGPASSSISAVTVVRPLLVSLAFGVLAPAVCVLVVRPITAWLNTLREKSPAGYLNQVLAARGTAFMLHTLILFGCVTAATYAGTSNLFAAYVAGASISWWDSEVPHLGEGPTTKTSTATPANANEAAVMMPETSEGSSVAAVPSIRDKVAPGVSGREVYERYYAVPVSRVLRPFFFVGYPHCLWRQSARANRHILGLDRIFYPDHRNVFRPDCLERLGIHDTDDIGQGCLRSLASPAILQDRDTLQCQTTSTKLT